MCPAALFPYARVSQVSSSCRAAPIEQTSGESELLLFGKANTQGITVDN